MLDSKFSLSYVKYPDVKSTTINQSTGNGWYSVGTVKHKNPETQEELAKLFAASPDLLYACQALKEAYDLGEENGGVDWSDLDQAYKLAVDALKKAGLA